MQPNEQEDRRGNSLETTSLLDETYPHGKLHAKALNGNDGYLLALQYKNPVSLGKALRVLRGVVYFSPAENNRAIIWLDADAARNLPHALTERLAYLGEFEIKETTRPCHRCKRNDVLYATGKFGHQLRLVCLMCSRFASATNEKALAAREEADRVKNVSRKFLPIRKLAKAA